MSIDIDRLLVETAQKVAITRDGDGDINYGTTTSSACLYRDISSLQHLSNREEVSLDGILWFGASEVVARGDIYLHADEGYMRIIKVLPAKRRLIDNTKQFIRCEVVKQRQIS